MDASQTTYLIFGLVLLIALVFDLGLLSKKGQTVSFSMAIYQTIFWVALALAFFGFLLYEKGHATAIEYISAYLMEWSLSIDNIFVFILIFSFFSVKEQYYGRVLLIGILIAVLLRIIFITIGVALVTRFSWLLYIFGGILIYTGVAMFFAKHGEQTDLEKNAAYKLLKRFFPMTSSDGGGKFRIMENGKKVYTNIFAVVILLASTDIVFALDSIPAVFGISQDKLVIYTSNIFAVLGLRSLFFLLQGAVNRFKYLPQGIAVVLIFIGLKMLVEIFKIHLPVYVSLLVIVACIGTSMLYSFYRQKE